MPPLNSLLAEALSCVASCRRVKAQDGYLSFSEIWASYPTNSTYL